MCGFDNIAKVNESSICPTSPPDVYFFKIYMLQKGFHPFKAYIIIFYLFVLFWPIDYSVFTQQPPEEEMDSKSFDEMEQSLLILSETKASRVSTMSLWKQQVYTIAKFHFLTLKRESKSVRSV